MKVFRKDKIVELCTGKRVLHLGFIQHHDLYEKRYLRVIGYMKK